MIWQSISCACQLLCNHLFKHPNQNSWIINIPDDCIQSLCRHLVPAGHRTHCDCEWINVCSSRQSCCSRSELAVAALRLLTLRAKHFLNQVELSGRVIGLSTVQCNRRDSWRPLCPLGPASAVWSPALQRLCPSERHRAVHHHIPRHELYSAALHIYCCNYCHILALIFWALRSRPCFSGCFSLGVVSVHIYVMSGGAGRWRCFVSVVYSGLEHVKYWIFRAVGVAYVRGCKYDVLWCQVKVKCLLLSSQKLVFLLHLLLMICVEATCVLSVLVEERRELSENVGNWRLLEALNMTKTRHFLPCLL